MSHKVSLTSALQFHLGVVASLLVFVALSSTVCVLVAAAAAAAAAASSSSTEVPWPCRDPFHQQDDLVVSSLFKLDDDDDDDDDDDESPSLEMLLSSSTPTLSSLSKVVLEAPHRMIPHPVSKRRQQHQYHHPPLLQSTILTEEDTSSFADQQQQRQRQHHVHPPTESLLQELPSSSSSRTRSTGTTIVALLANNSTVLILAADTRSTDGTIVADKTCQKLHALSKNVWCAGAGTSADIEAFVRRVKFTFWKRGIRLTESGGGVGNYHFRSSTNGSCIRGKNNTTTDHRNNNNNKDYYDYHGTEDNVLPWTTSSVPAMMHYIRTQLGKMRGNLGANLLVGGYDYNLNRALLAAVHPHGSMDVVNYSALGSGGLAAMGVLESKYPKQASHNNYCGGEGTRREEEPRGIIITIEEGIQLAIEAVKAGIENDLGSGSQIDVCLITREGTTLQRAFVKEQALNWGMRERADHGPHFGTTMGINNSTSTMKNNEKPNPQHTIIGINGFGNVPFVIRSKRYVVREGIPFCRNKIANHLF